MAGKILTGRLIGMNTDTRDLMLAEAVVDGKKHHRMYLAGAILAEITLGEAPFDMNVLKMELEKVFKKTGVRYYEDTRTIMVMDRYRVTEEEVQGDGPVADRIRRIWQSMKDEYTKEKEESDE